MTAAIIVVIGAMWQGMSASTLLEGVVWGPSRHPGVFNVRLQISTKKMILDVLMTAGIACLYWFRDRWRPCVDWVGALRFVIGLD